MPRLKTLALVAGCCSALIACGGDGGNGPVIVPTNESPGGIWNGTDSQTGRGVTGLVTETGEFHFVRDDGTQYVGTVTTKGITGSGSFEAFAPPGTAFADGSTHGTGTLSGTIHQRSSVSATTQFTTDKGSQSSDTLTLSFNSLYNRTSSLATIAGNFTDASTQTVYTIDANGAIFAQDPTSACVITGFVTTIDTAYNAYRVKISYQNCTGQYQVLDGLTLTGLGALDNTVSPERAVLGLSGTVGATKIAVWDVLNRT